MQVWQQLQRHQARLRSRSDRLPVLRPENEGRYQALSLVGDKLTCPYPAIYEQELADQAHTPERMPMILTRELAKIFLENEKVLTGEALARFCTMLIQHELKDLMVKFEFRGDVLSASDVRQRLRLYAAFMESLNTPCPTNPSQESPTKP